MHNGHLHSTQTQADDLDDLGEGGMLSFAGLTRLRAVKQPSNSGNPAVIGLSSLRPVTLRPYLSIGLPFYRTLQL